MRVYYHISARRFVKSGCEQEMAALKEQQGHSERRPFLARDKVGFVHICWREKQWADLGPLHNILTHSAYFLKINFHFCHGSMVVGPGLGDFDLADVW